MLSLLNTFFHFYADAHQLKLADGYGIVHFYCDGESDTDGHANGHKHINPVGLLEWHLHRDLISNEQPQLDGDCDLDRDPDASFYKFGNGLSLKRAQPFRHTEYDRDPE